MKLFFVLTACFAAVLARSANDLIQGKIIGGNNATLGQFPFQVAIVYDSASGPQICGGSLINNRWVLTAAHCVCGGSFFKIVIGGTELDEPGKLINGIIEAYVHPKYNIPMPLNNDIGLLKLAYAVTFTKTIQPIRLSRADDYLQPNVPLFISGWGQIADSAQITLDSYLKYVSLTSISNDKCKTYFKPTFVPKNVVCAQGRGTDSPCHGDSGGPLVKIDHDGKLTQVGVASFVHNMSCERTFPSAFSRVADFLPFIRQYAHVMTN